MQCLPLCIYNNNKWAVVCKILSENIHIKYFFELLCATITFNTGLEDTWNTIGRTQKYKYIRISKIRSFHIDVQGLMIRIQMWPRPQLYIITPKWRGFRYSYYKVSIVLSKSKVSDLWHYCCNTLYFDKTSPQISILHLNYQGTLLRTVTVHVHWDTAIHNWGKGNRIRFMT